MTRAALRRPICVRNLESHALVVLVRSGAELGRWPLVGPWRPDLGMVDDLARSQLALRRLGCSLQLHHARPELRRLLLLVGLESTIPCVDLVRSTPPLTMPALTTPAHSPRGPRRPDGAAGRPWPAARPCPPD
jgi:hypothetical protein